MLKSLLKNNSQSPSKSLFREDRKAILNRFIFAMVMAVGIFIGGDLADTVDQSTEFGSAIALLLTWAGNAIYIYYKNNQPESDSS